MERELFSNQGNPDYLVLFPLISQKGFGPGRGLGAKKPVGELRVRVSPGDGGTAGRATRPGAPPEKRSVTREMPLSLSVQMRKDNGHNNRSKQHPDWPKQPQEQQHTEEIAPHAHGVMHHAAVENSCYIFWGYFVS